MATVEATSHGPTADSSVEAASVAVASEVAKDELKSGAVARLGFGFRFGCGFGFGFGFGLGLGLSLGLSLG